MRLNNVVKHKQTETVYYFVAFLIGLVDFILAKNCEINAGKGEPKV